MDNNHNKNNHNNDNSNNNNINTTTRHHHTTTNNRSMSDTDSQYDEFHSPLRSPLQQDDLPTSSPSKAIIPVPYPPTKPVQPLTRPPTVLSYNLATREEPVTGVTKVNPSVAGGGGGGGGEEGQGGERRVRTTTPLPPARRVKREVAVERVGLGFRVMEAVLCLIAFSVMVSDKTQGWSGDSFDRYKEYRYVVAVNAIAFAYAAFQAIEMTYRLIYKKHIVSFSLRPVFDFLIDQILAYLLISASSSAATRVDDWVSNWGKDDFTEMATASIGMSFLAFVAFAVSSLISGYILCNQKSL